MENMGRLDATRERRGLRVRLSSLSADPKRRWVFNKHDTVSERLRRWTRNPLGSARRGSNPLGVVLLRRGVLRGAQRCNPCRRLVCIDDLALCIRPRADLSRDRWIQSPAC